MNNKEMHFKSRKWLLWTLALSGLMVASGLSWHLHSEGFFVFKDQAHLDESIARDTSPNAAPTPGARAGKLASKRSPKRTHGSEQNAELSFQDDVPPSFSEGPVGAKLSSLYGSVDSGSPEDDIKAEQLFEELRGNAAEAVAEIARAYRELDNSQFIGRYKLTYIAENLKVKEARTFLEGVATSAVPAEIPAYQGDGSVDYYEKEIMVKVRAVGGLTKLAEEGDAAARSAVYQLISQTADITLKKDAIYGFLKSSEDVERDIQLLQSELPPAQHKWLSLQEDRIESLSVDSE